LPTGTNNAPSIHVTQAERERAFFAALKERETQRKTGAGSRSPREEALQNAANAAMAKREADKTRALQHRAQAFARPPGNRLLSKSPRRHRNSVGDAPAAAVARGPVSRGVVSRPGSGGQPVPSTLFPGSRSMAARAKRRSSAADGEAVREARAAALAVAANMAKEA